MSWGFWLLRLEPRITEIIAGRVAGYKAHRSTKNGLFILPLVRINCYSGHSVTPNITPSFFFAEMMVDVAYISEKVISDASG